MVPGTRWFLFAVLLLAGCTSQERAGKDDYFVLAVSHEPVTSDPHITTAAGNFAILSHFYEPLVMTDANMKILPWLAQSWETKNPLTWVFHLQPGILFHDGKKLTSADVVYSIRRILEHPELEPNAYLREIVSVTALDAMTVQVNTAVPVVLLLNRLRFIPIISLGDHGNLLSKRINGTGPYRLVDWLPKKRIRMIRNENYWRELPDLKRVEFLLSYRPEKAIELLKAGGCRMIQYGPKKLETNEVPPDFQILRQNSLFLKLLSFDLFPKQTPQFQEGVNPFLDTKLAPFSNQKPERGCQSWQRRFT